MSTNSPFSSDPADSTANGETTNQDGTSGTTPPPPTGRWGAPPKPPVTPSGSPEPAVKRRSKPVIIASAIGLFLSGCVSGCVSGAAIIQSNRDSTPPTPRATVTVTASASTAPSTRPPSTPPLSELSTPPTPPAPVSPPEPTQEPAAQPPAPDPGPAPDADPLTQQTARGTITITAFSPSQDEFTGTKPLLCTTATFASSGDRSWSINSYAFELAAPDHSRTSPAIFSSGRNIPLTTLEPGDTVAGEVCFEDSGQRGAYTLIWDEPFVGSVRWNITIP
ncbi:hypothetical protein [Stomatohabitans albus]|uniref:hypothetical protein n=1 Tax=Stomatohabitans albus TaxID=3110766 RepID=UPI00300C8CC4